MSAAVLLLSACSGTSRQPVVEVPLVLPTVGPAASPAGALTGAWVMPEDYTTAGQLGAVVDFESRIGRPLDFVHVFRRWDDPFPRPVDVQLAGSHDALLLSWNSAGVRAITSGSEDATIRRMAQAVKSLGTPVWIRWRWEMNRPNLQGLVSSPADYVAAWKRLRTMFEAEQVTNAAWVWCPLATGWDETDAPAYYPGDDQVDWLCADVYPSEDRTFAEVAAPFLDWAKGHPQPIIIGEFGIAQRSDLDRADWIGQAFAAIRSNARIRAVCYFEGDTKGSVTDYYELEPGTPELAAFVTAVNTPYFDTRS